LQSIGTLPQAVQTRLNQSRDAIWDMDLGGPKETCIT